VADPSSPNQSRPEIGEIGEAPASPRASSPRVSSGDLKHGPASSRASVPPSEPRSSRASFDALDAQVDRPARLQMIVALFLGLVLVAIPLYLWRRPRADSIAVSTGAADGGALPAVTGGSPGTGEGVVTSEAKNLSCHDPGPKKTPAEQCDHVPELEKAFAKAVEENASCVPRDAGGGTIIFVADVGFKKRLVSVTTPPQGRTLKSAKIAGACERAIKNKLASIPFDSIKHEHARYRVSITATYPGPVKP
jgi:hypothetical protein